MPQRFFIKNEVLTLDHKVNNPTVCGIPDSVRRLLVPVQCSASVPISEAIIPLQIKKT